MSTDRAFHPHNRTVTRHFQQRRQIYLAVVANADPHTIIAAALPDLVLALGT